MFVENIEVKRQFGIHLYRYEETDTMDIERDGVWSCRKDLFNMGLGLMQNCFEIQIKTFASVYSLKNLK